ncbi:MAG TPA: DUF1761 domain-containing protein [Candidatus Nanoarchaeia archaeon]|nr:DUF1761 domain-containing protein [Candidatus Nanoarchaeia archaeon]
MVNYLAVLVAAVVSFLVGWVWFSKPVFGKVWMSLMGLKKEPKHEGMAKNLVIGFLGTLVTAYVLAYFVDMLGYMTALSGMMVGFWAWLGFVATTTVGGVLWENKPWSLWLLNNGHNLVTLLITGAIVGAWV